MGRLGMAKKINKEAFKSILTRIWRTKIGRVFFKEIQDNLWLFEFAEESGKKTCSGGETLVL